jgi:hypothetical protein
MFLSEYILQGRYRNKAGLSGMGQRLSWYGSGIRVMDTKTAKSGDCWERHYVLSGTPISSWSAGANESLTTPGGFTRKGKKPSTFPQE